MYLSMTVRIGNIKNWEAIKIARSKIKNAIPGRKYDIASAAITINKCLSSSGYEVSVSIVPVRKKRKCRAKVEIPQPSVQEEVVVQQEEPQKRKRSMFNFEAPISIDDVKYKIIDHVIDKKNDRFYYLLQAKGNRFAIAHAVYHKKGYKDAVAVKKYKGEEAEEDAWCNFTFLCNTIYSPRENEKSMLPFFPGIIRANQ